MLHKNSPGTTIFGEYQKNIWVHSPPNTPLGYGLAHTTTLCLMSYSHMIFILSQQNGEQR